MGFTEILVLIDLVASLHCTKIINEPKLTTNNCVEEIRDCILDEGVRQSTWCLENYGESK